MSQAYFSRRLPAERSMNALSRLDRSPNAIDLMVVNPTVLSFNYPEPLMRAVHAGAYAPSAAGSMTARRSVATYLGPLYAAEQVLLTASTSEAYAMLFKVLCDPGACVAVGEPSYPLLAHLCELEGVRIEPFKYLYRAGWQLDDATLVAALNNGAKAVVLVSPNNPTGSVVEGKWARHVARLCRAYDAALIVDDVFAPYYFAEPVAGATAFVNLPPDEAPLTFVLGGVSKAVGLPGAKLAWIYVHGPQDLVAEAYERLAFVADLSLSVSSAAEAALPTWLAHAETMQAQLRLRVQRNRAVLRSLLWPQAAVHLCAAAAGFYAVIRVPDVLDEDALVTHLGHTCDVWLHPGYYYDLTLGVHCVTGLLQPEPTFALAWQRLAHAFAKLY